jgi:hypothetical protein
MGYQGDSMQPLNDGRQLVGNRCSITVDQEMYNGEWRSKVGFVNPIGESPLEKDERAAANAARFDALLRKEAKKPVEREQQDAPDDEPPPPLDNDGYGIPDDDYPF